VAPSALAQAFGRIMKGAGMVDDRGRPRFSFHALRHYAASCWVMHNSTIGGIQQVARWLGHSDSGTLLKVYAHAIHDPEAQARFLRMQNWLTREVALPAPPPVAMLAAPAEIVAPFVAEIECPLPVPEHAAKWLKLLLVDLWRDGDLNEALRAQGKGRDTLRYELKRCGLPTMGEIEVMAWGALSAGAPAPAVPVMVLEPECPIDLPEIAPSWLRVFVRLLDSGMTGEAAAREVRQQPATVRDELQRLKVAPSIAELAHRLRHKRIIALHEAGYQTAEVARLAGVHVNTVADLRRELQVSDPRGGKVGPAATKAGWALRRHKTATSNPLTDKEKSASPAEPAAQPKHKISLSCCNPRVSLSSGGSHRYASTSTAKPQKPGEMGAPIGRPLSLSRNQRRAEQTLRNPGLCPAYPRLHNATQQSHNCQAQVAIRTRSWIPLHSPDRLTAAKLTN
jgi:hypothetical protein